MLTKWMAATLVAGGLAVEVQAAERPVVATVKPVVWRGGYRFRSSSNRSVGNSSAYRGWTRTSALDYPPWTQPYVSRTNSWNKYPNQPFYLRGERKSLLILP